MDELFQKSLKELRERGMVANISFVDYSLQFPKSLYSATRLSTVLIEYHELVRQYSSLDRVSRSGFFLRFSMRFSNRVSALALSLLSFYQECFSTPIIENSAPVQQRSELSGNTEFVKRGGGGEISPKVFIISMFEPEASVWYGINDFDVFEQNITLPGLSPLYPHVHCTGNGDVCQFTIGESG
jgi:hypothetical protein